MPRKGIKTKKARQGDAAVAAFRRLASALPKGGRRQKQPGRSAARPRKGGRGLTIMGASAQPTNRPGYASSNAPLARGARLGPVGMSMSSDYQTNTDQGHCPGVRVTGTDISRISLAANSSYLGGVRANNTGNPALSVSFGPYGISPRLTGIAAYYSWYAIRYLEVVVVPNVGPSSARSTTSMGAADLVALGFDTDVSSATNDGATSLNQIMELDTSMCFPVWEGGSMTYRFDGTKVWATSTNNSSTNPDYLDSEQIALFAAWSTYPAVTATTDVGLIYVRYVVDLYRPQEVTVYPSVSAPRVRDLRREFDRLALKLASVEREDLEEEEKSDTALVLVPPSDGLSARSRQRRA